MEVPQGDYRTMDPARIVEFLLDHEHSLLEKQATLKAYAAAVEGPTTDDFLRVFSRLFKTIPPDDRYRTKALSFVIEAILHADVKRRRRYRIH